MIKTLRSFFVVLLISSHRESPAQEDQPRPSFNVRTNLLGFSEAEQRKIHQASGLIKRIVGSEEFRDAILNHTWRGKKAFSDSQGLSNEEIYKKIIEGSELQTGHGPNFTMDLEIELYTDMNSFTIGYTYPSIMRIYMNKKYLSKFAAHQVADNMMHEWLHKLGFNHSVKKNPERKYSVPYAIGYIVEDLARKGRFDL